MKMGLAYLYGFRIDDYCCVKNEMTSNEIERELDFDGTQIEWIKRIYTYF